jgi:hypothetical protein
MRFAEASSSLNRVVATVMLLHSAFVGAAHAEVVQLTGGNPSDGLALDPGAVVAAIYTPSDGNFSQSIFTNATQAFQGVTFAATSANVARGASSSGTSLYLLPQVGDLTPTSAAFSNPGSPSTQDSNLLSPINAGAWFNTEYLTFTVSNLAADTDYRVETLSSNLGYGVPRSYTVSYNSGSVADTLAFATSAEASYIYAIRDVVRSTGAGEITIRYDRLTGDGPAVSALAVSALSPSAVPEIDPAGMGSVLALLGGVLGLVERRRLKVA